MKSLEPTDTNTLRNRSENIAEDGRMKPGTNWGSFPEWSPSWSRVLSLAVPQIYRFRPRRNFSQKPIALNPEITTRSKKRLGVPKMWCHNVFTYIKHYVTRRWKKWFKWFIIWGSWSWEAWSRRFTKLDRDKSESWIQERYCNLKSIISLPENSISKDIVSDLTLMRLQFLVQCTSPWSLTTKKTYILNYLNMDFSLGSNTFIWRQQKKNVSDSGQKIIFSLFSAFSLLQYKATLKKF